jgi:hypothetical protein
MRPSIALFFILLGTLVSVGVVHGIWTERWYSADVPAELQDLRKLPLTVGRWDGKELQRDSAQEALPNAPKNLLLRYVNRFDGTSADVLLGRGRPGPMVIFHLPPECYPAAGYEMIGKPKRYLSPSDDGNGVSDEFWVATFKKSTDLFPITVRVYWSWSATGGWRAPDSPRFTFAPYKAIYKLYVVQTIPDERAELEGSPAHDLIKELTKASRESLFSTTAR